jgi:hypothetical protein
MVLTGGFAVVTLGIITMRNAKRGPLTPTQ